MKNITLLSLFNLALKHIGALILAAAVFAGATLAYCEFFATPRYSATGSIVVASGAMINDPSGDKTSISNTDISASINLSDTVADILSTTGIYKQLSERIDNDDLSFINLQARSKVVRREDYSLFMDITFEAESKEEAILLVNTFLELAPDYISEFVPGTASATAPCDVAKKIYPSTVTFTILAAFVGVALCFAVFLIIDMLDTIIHTEDDVTDVVDIPVIGSIPDFATAKSTSYYKYSYYRSNRYERGVNKNGR